MKIKIFLKDGRGKIFLDVEKAIDFINDYENIPEDSQLEYIEVVVSYNNGTRIQCQFREKVEAIDFLNKIK